MGAHQRPPAVIAADPDDEARIKVAIHLHQKTDRHQEWRRKQEGENR